METAEFASKVYRNATLYVPEGSLELYQAADVWKNFWSIKEIVEEPEVPEEPVYLTLQHADNGSIKQQLEKGDSCCFVIEAAEGWSIHAVTFNGEDVTAQLVDGHTFVTPAILTDAVLNVSFEQEGNAVKSAHANDVKVTGKDDAIIISGMRQGDDIAVYTTDGVLVVRQVASAENISITVDADEVYIVKVAEKVVKIQM